MLKSKENWSAVREFAKDIITKKEDEERRRQNSDYLVKNYLLLAEGQSIIGWLEAPTFFDVVKRNSIIFTIVITMFLHKYTMETMDEMI